MKFLRTKVTLNSEMKLNLASGVAILVLHKTKDFSSERKSQPHCVYKHSISGATQNPLVL